jgi:hypothetical protein
MEINEVRRRLRLAIEQARREAAERRARSDAAERDYEQFLAERAAPVFHDVANALTGEGHPFKVFTPARSVKLASSHASDDFIELDLDTSQDPPHVIGRSSRGRGRRNVTSERPVKTRTPVADLSEEDVLAFVLSEIGPLVER